MRLKYSVITIVFNPNSTGKSKQKATELAASLRSTLPKAKVRLRASKYKGHMETMAYRTAMISRHALIIAVSGDGGYNEVVNGAVRAQKLGRHVTVGLLPAGNANDHYASMHRGDLTERIAACDEDENDILEITGRSQRRVIRRYGHSYIGIGLTPQASEKLNRVKLNVWEEAKIIFTVFVHMKSIKLIVKNKVVHYDSLLFTNTSRMSKVIKVSKRSSPTDGEFEVSHLYRRNKFKLITALAQAAVFGLETDERTDRYEFSTVKKTAVQTDGEVIMFDAGAKVTVTCKRQFLHSIV